MSFRKWGGSKAIWNSPKNSSLLVLSPFPNTHIFPNEWGNGRVHKDYWWWGRIRAWDVLCMDITAANVLILLLLDAQRNKSFSCRTCGILTSFPCIQGSKIERFHEARNILFWIVKDSESSPCLSSCNEMTCGLFISKANGPPSPSTSTTTPPSMHFKYQWPWCVPILQSCYCILFDKLGYVTNPSSIDVQKISNSSPQTPTISAAKFVFKWPKLYQLFQFHQLYMQCQVWKSSLWVGYQWGFLGAWNQERMA